MQERKTVCFPFISRPFGPVHLIKRDADPLINAYFFGCSLSVFQPEYLATEESVYWIDFKVPSALSASHAARAVGVQDVERDGGKARAGRKILQVLLTKISGGNGRDWYAMILGEGFAPIKVSIYLFGFPARIRKERVV